MLRIAVIDDEIQDLLQVVSNLVLFDPHAQQTQILPILLSDMSASSVNRESESWEKARRGEWTSKILVNFIFPRIISLGPLDTGKEQERSQILNLLAEKETDVIFCDSWMGEETAGTVLLEAALADARWADNKWQCWLTTKWPKIAKDIRDYRWRKFDPRAWYLDKNKIISACGNAECDPNLRDKVEEALRQKRASAEVKGQTSLGRLVGQSFQMNGPRRVYASIKTAAGANDPVLITGENGTGKELIAREIHDRSNSESFVSYNCSLFTNEMMGSELFGHERGAFTDAIRRKIGLFEKAKKGTLFLDEIGDLPSELQAKLLRVIEERLLTRLGGNGEIDVASVRLISATSRDLGQGIEEGWFSEALYYRLSLLQIRTPPLRERLDDIPLLADHFIGQFNSETGWNFGLSNEAIPSLKTHKWPGNVRQFRNVIKRACLNLATDLGTDRSLAESDLAPQRQEIQANYILESLRAEERGAQTKSVALPAPAASQTVAVITGQGSNTKTSSEPPRAESTQSAAERDWELIMSGKLKRGLAEEKEWLGKENFPDFFRLLLQWLNETYPGGYPKDKVTQKFFGISKATFKAFVVRNREEYGSDL